MKKIIKITFLSLIFMLGFMVNIKAKDFCQLKEEQEESFLFDCKSMSRRCVYENIEFGIDVSYLNIFGFLHSDLVFTEETNLSTIYLDISNEENAKIKKRGTDSRHYIINWGKEDSYGFGDAKAVYKKNQACPDIIIEANVGEYYAVEEENAMRGSANGINPSEKKYYYLNKSDYSNYDNCTSFKTQEKCRIGTTDSGKKFGCAWNEEYKFCSPSGLAYLTCGSDNTKAYDIPPIVPKLSSYAVVALKTATPIVLIIMGMFQLIKAITSQKEDEMKKARGTLIKKLIAAVLIFFTVSIVQFVIKIAADSSETGSLENCLECFLNNDCDGSMYYTDGYGKCYNVSNGDTIDCPVDNY